MRLDKRSLFVRVGSCFLLLLACFYMCDFYKSLSGFVANGFREPMVMLPMILGFFLPVLCFLFFFYDFYVRAIHPVVKTVYSVFVAVYAAADLVLIFRNMGLYASNFALGVYDALPGVILHFPYDTIVVLAVLLALQIFHLAVGDRKNTRAGAWLNGLKQRGSVKVGVAEYCALGVLAVVAFMFTGVAIVAAFTAFANTFYDVRYLFLLVWVMVVPLSDLLLLTLKPERWMPTKRARLTLFGTAIGVNVLFALLFWICELTYPDFIVHIGKPLFFIAFSVSIPIEPLTILLIMAITVALLTARLVLAAKARKETEK